MTCNVKHVKPYLTPQIDHVMEREAFRFKAKCSRKSALTYSLLVRI
jgi:hypothetical protein